MSVKRFVAADMRRALELVRQEMGAEAIILSSKRVKGGVEILTSNDPYYQSVAEKPTAPRATPSPRSAMMSSSMDDDPMMDTPMSSDIAWGQESIMGRLMSKQEQAEAAPESMQVRQQARSEAQPPQNSFANTFSEQFAVTQTQAHSSETATNSHDRVELSIDGQAKAQQIARAQRQKSRNRQNQTRLQESQRTISGEQIEPVHHKEKYVPQRIDQQPSYRPQVLHESQPIYGEEAHTDTEKVAEPLEVTYNKPCVITPAMASQPDAPMEQGKPGPQFFDKNGVDEFLSYPEASFRWKKDMGLPLLSEKKRVTTQDEYFSMPSEVPGVDAMRHREEQCSIGGTDNDSVNQLFGAAEPTSVDDGSSHIEIPVSPAIDEVEVVPEEPIEQPQPVNQLQLGSYSYQQSEADIVFHLDPNTYVTPAANDTSDIVDDDGVFIDEIFDEQFSQLKNEIGDMREFLRDQLAVMSEQTAAQAREAERKVEEQARQFAEEKAQLVAERRAKIVGNTMRTTIKRRLQQLGMSDVSISKCLAEVSSDLSLNSNWAKSLATISHDIPVVGKDVIGNGGFFAFVGPSGAGKTAAVSKLASRYVLEHGSSGVAIVTMASPDSGGNHRLRRLGSILNVSVYEVNEKNKLEYVLQDLADHKLVLIDTEGANCQGKNLKYQLRELRQLPQVENILVLSANTQVQFLKAATHNFKRANLRGCVITKLDETASLGEVLGVLINADIPIAYTTQGASMPQDVTMARAHQLITKAVSLLKESGQRYVKSKKILSHKSTLNTEKSAVNAGHKVASQMAKSLQNVPVQRAVAP